MSTQVAQIQKAFFSSTEFAVVGASKDQSKFGTKVCIQMRAAVIGDRHSCMRDKVLKWYKNHDKIVTPIHPVSPSQRLVTHS
jgi:hypothetical protein